MSPKSVLSSCISRKAFAKACCSEDSEEMASLNSTALGIVAACKGIRSSSWLRKDAKCKSRV